ncbi:LOW QUALITY PROTEIN: Single Ig IL-1-related receptor, partial [Galemys pyrenaicus]
PAAAAPHLPGSGPRCTGRGGGSPRGGQGAHVTAAPSFLAHGWVGRRASSPTRPTRGPLSAGVCDQGPNFISPPGGQVLHPAPGSVVTLNCTAWVDSGPHCPPPSVQWLRNGQPLGNGSHYSLREDFWLNPNSSEGFMSSVLGVNLTSVEDFGVFTCCIGNLSSAPFLLSWAGPAGHVATVLASVLVLATLLLAALLYVKCRLRLLLWYHDAHGEVEVNDGKLYDAYISYSDSPEDRKFVNFILKPQLERRRGYKLFLDDRDLLPRAEPSADLLVDLSRCRRLIVVLSDAFLGRAWCSHSFREGLCRLLELTRRPIFITFEGQRRAPVHPALRLLRQHRHLVTLLLWRPGSVVRALGRGVGPGRGHCLGCVGAGRAGAAGRSPTRLTRPQTPSSDFWKELQLALPRKVQYRAMEGDPQTQMQDDKDPMLIVRGPPDGRSAQGHELDPDPEGDLGVRGAVFRGPPAPFQASEDSLGEGRGSEMDVSDLGSRNYGARTDFYCLVSKDDV